MIRQDGRGVLPFRELPYFLARGRMGLSGIKDLYTRPVRYVKADARLMAGDPRLPAHQLRSAAISALAT